MMTRNMVRRVEILFPIYSAEIKQRIMHIFSTQLADNVKARVQDSTGKFRYKERKEGEPVINSQELFILEATSTVMMEE